MTQKKVLITGASGFVGANLVRYLVEAGYKHVHVFIRRTSDTWRLEGILKKVKVHYVDILDLAMLKKKMQKIKPDIIYHNAMYGGYPYQSDKRQMIAVNTFGTMNVLESLSDIKYKHFVQVGTSSEYGLKTKPMKETDNCIPVTTYGISKLSATHMAQQYAVINKKPITSVRIFSAYGPYEDKDRLIPYLICSYLLERKCEVKSAEAVRDYLYVEDIVKFLVKVGQGKKGLGILNLGAGKQYKVKDVVKVIEKVTGAKLNVKWGKARLSPLETPMWQADMRKSKRVVKGLNFRSFEKGIAQTIQWFSDILK